MRGISLLAEDLSASQEGLCSVELFSAVSTSQTLPGKILKKNFGVKWGEACFLPPKLTLYRQDDNNSKKSLLWFTTGRDNFSV
jgi:hypothetical protein